MTGTGTHAPDEPQGLLCCPRSGDPLERVPRAAGEQRVGGLVASPRTGSAAEPLGASDEVLLRGDGAAAYPVVDGVPVLMSPEMLTAPGDARVVDLQDPRYAEAYAEQEFYGEMATDDHVQEQGGDWVGAIARAPQAQRDSFPDPALLWLDAPFDCTAQYDAYRHMAPVRGLRVLQVGGSGHHAVRLLQAGAREAWLATPVLEETRFGHRLAEIAGVADRFHSVVAVGEELPFRDGCFDRVYSGASMHHTLTELSFREIARTLAQGGRFAATEPWRAPLYAVGTRVFGKREPDVFCRPLTGERVRPLFAHFPHARVIQYGALLRYPLIVLHKLGVSAPLRVTFPLLRADDWIAARLRLRRLGGSVALLASR